MIYRMFNERSTTNVVVISESLNILLTSILGIFLQETFRNLSLVNQSIPSINLSPVVNIYLFPTQSSPQDFYHDFYHDSSHVVF